SYVIGDKIIDIKTAHSVGAKGILVLTGYGAEEIKSVHQNSEDKPDHVAANLNEAVAWIIEETIMSHGSQSKMKIPLNPPFSKGEISFPPLEKGGEEGFETGFSDNARRRILIVKPSSLGDIIHSLPVLWALRKTYPDAYIGWVVKEVWQDVLSENPLIDRLIILGKGAGGIFSAIREVRRMRFDTVIDLQGLFRSGIITYFSGATERSGFSNARELAPIFYNNKVIVPQGHIHAVDRYMMTVSNPTLLNFPLYIAIDDAEWAKEFLMENNLYNKRPLIAINPSARWVKKRWPAASFSALINQLINELKAGIIIVGSKEDIPIAEEINSHVNERIAIATGKTSLKRLPALLANVNLLVTNDSGPMHIAAAIGTPVVALFGPTDHRLTGPYGSGHVVISKDMDCKPCLRRPCKHGKPLCMEMIAVEDVVNAVKKILARQSKLVKGGPYAAK
ncbi:MAG: lipopolysaccharide heptosyltransferase II, partial [Nitrospirota bacterium]